MFNTYGSVTFEEKRCYPTLNVSKRCYSSAPGSGPSVGESPAVVIYSKICKLEKEKIIRENRNKSGIYR